MCLLNKIKDVRINLDFVSLLTKSWAVIKIDINIINISGKRLCNIALIGEIREKWWLVKKKTKFEGEKWV